MEPLPQSLTQQQSTAQPTPSPRPLIVHSAFSFSQNNVIVAYTPQTSGSSRYSATIDGEAFDLQNHKKYEALTDALFLKAKLVELAAFQLRQGKYSIEMLLHAYDQKFARDPARKSDLEKIQVIIFTDRLSELLTLGSLGKSIDLFLSLSEESIRFQVFRELTKNNNTTATLLEGILMTDGNEKEYDTIINLLSTLPDTTQRYSEITTLLSSLPEDEKTITFILYSAQNKKFRHIAPTIPKPIIIKYLPWGTEEQQFSLLALLSRQQQIKIITDLLTTVHNKKIFNVFFKIVHQNPDIFTQIPLHSAALFLDVAQNAETPVFFKKLSPANQISVLQEMQNPEKALLLIQSFSLSPHIAPQHIIRLWRRLPAAIIQTYCHSYKNLLIGIARAFQ